jgi:hypothetical protein
MKFWDKVIELTTISEQLTVNDWQWMTDR